MKLSEIIGRITGARVIGDAQASIGGIAYDSRKVSKGDCFVAIKGGSSDGHDFIEDAIGRGAQTIVAERSLSVPPSVTLAVVKDSHLALAEISSAFFGDPSAGMRVIGITGTNGKTTITYLAESVLKKAGREPGVVGTVSWRYKGKIIPAPNTTPVSYELQKLMSEMKAAGVADVVMEVSSHALAQGRVACVGFDAAIFTNLTQDHLDYHRTVDEYFGAKKCLFTKYLIESSKPGRVAAVNIDGEYGGRIVAALEGANVSVVTYGFSKGADVRAERVESLAAGSVVKMATPWGSLEYRSNLCGKFNVENVAAVVASFGAMNVPLDIIKAGIEEIKSVPGRMEAVPNKKGISIFVDYAHTPDALKNVITTLKAVTKGRLITVFGCGGDRDKGKRPMMGEVAASLSDVVIVTSDNPRSEPPARIIEDIVAGVKKAGLKTFSAAGRGYILEENRSYAIERAVLMAKKGDAVLIAGKGHETYQIVGGETRHFDDREEVLKCLSDQGNQ